MRQFSTGGIRKLELKLHNDLLNLFHPWKNLKVFELAEVMRQQGDTIFIDLLNNLIVGAVSKIDIALISSRSCSNQKLLKETTYLFAENILKDNFNNQSVTK